MATIEEIQAQIVEDFSFLPQWEEKYAYLIELGQKMEPLPKAYQTEENLVRGCQSTVWLHRECQDGLVTLKADSDSLIVKGLAALLLKVYSGQTGEAIQSKPLTFLEETRLNRHLSSQRANGLLAMIDQIKLFAKTCSSN
jgi:cysteine desulfuration protein SufE